MSSDSNTAHVKALVLDATPLITQSYTHYQRYAKSFYTTPTVFQEIKDAQARKNLEIWQSLGTLNLRHPNQDSIATVSKFAKLTGDFQVLSANDIHILALAYELETELNKGDWRLRKVPGESLDHLGISDTVEHIKEDQGKEDKESVPKEEGGEKKKKKTRRGGKKQRAKREAEAQVEAESQPQVQQDKEDDEEVITQVEAKVETEVVVPKVEKENEELGEEYGEEDDDGDWITPDNLTEMIIKDSGEDTTGSRGVEASEQERNNALDLPSNQVALATGDFAVQNVALQLNLNLMNFMSGLRIKRLRNYMLRCHACFKLLPLPKDGKAKHFCPSCGLQNTLLRCAVSVDSETGKITPHLKSNFQWINRGNVYSIASPLSKNSQKKYGKKGYIHSKPQYQEVILREDQKEYSQLMKQEEWTNRHNEKVLDNWIGGGSADNYMSPFAITGLKHHSVKVNRGRYVNSVRRKK
ncbi:hypothetical protein Kpol_473p15 [Vanderwaltozyma polyspora DSM 70294]|uniref:20S-pre-rRNA D-site endonuclease NOB1 n=1 Tax=Vanderwaltozyma polyspora (strain ATCC 22028 / DSM 70294 / BCRC 21397 / CBS 2163 / NBRC 10782 / NRRL Y-8283 / UCD 57-17) TaxID=436907 RepID=A7TQ07_VANPO|nr:uncharacterized protein Kpol_473p15 [Vanderwaltozyma polyspora DSM 70294]EDO15656.1 hypothetical protein Kpol_473p15 [Vanderwaltozyma polyspora DSM 70294]